LSKNMMSSKKLAEIITVPYITSPNCLISSSIYGTYNYE
jgi:hypothetical protein